MERIRPRGKQQTSDIQDRDLTKKGPREVTHHVTHHSSFEC